MGINRQQRKEGFIIIQEVIFAYLVKIPVTTTLYSHRLFSPCESNSFGDLFCVSLLMGET